MLWDSGIRWSTVSLISTYPHPHHPLPYHLRHFPSVVRLSHDTICWSNAKPIWNVFCGALMNLRDVFRLIYPLPPSWLSILGEYSFSHKWKPSIWRADGVASLYWWTVTVIWNVKQKQGSVAVGGNMYFAAWALGQFCKLRRHWCFVKVELNSRDYFVLSEVVFRAKGSYCYSFVFEMFSKIVRKDGDR